MKIMIEDILHKANLETIKIVKKIKNIKDKIFEERGVDFQPYIAHCKMGNVWLFLMLNLMDEMSISSIKFYAAMFGASYCAPAPSTSPEEVKREMGVKYLSGLDPDEYVKTYFRVIDLHGWVDTIESKVCHLIDHINGDGAMKPIDEKALLIHRIRDLALKAGLQKESIQNEWISNIIEMDFANTNTNTIAPEIPKDISSWDLSGVTDFAGLFQGRQDLVCVDLSKCVIDATSTEEMFKDCWNLEYVRVPKVSGIMNAKAMFQNCFKLKRIDGLEEWDMSSVLNLSDMFFCCFNLENLNVEDWGLDSKVIVDRMFWGCDKIDFNFKKWVNRGVKIENTLMLKVISRDLTPEQLLRMLPRLNEAFALEEE